MKRLMSAAVIGLLAVPAFAEGDAAKGEKGFKKCKSCHMVVSDSGETIVKGGKTGPNLWGVAGRPAGSYEGFKYDAPSRNIRQERLLRRQRSACCLSITEML